MAITAAFQEHPIMSSHAAHLTIAGRPYCERLGCQAGLDLALKTGVSSCSYPSTAAAKRAAQALRPHLHSVRVVPGFCETGFETSETF